MPVKVMIPDELALRLKSAGALWGRNIKQEILFRCLEWETQVPDRYLRGTSKVPDRYLPQTPEVPDRYLIGTSEVPDDDTPETPAQRAMLLDMLMADGDRAHPKSNFQIRRSKQMAFLREQWTALFPTHPPLTDSTLKTFLRYSEDSAEVIRDAFEVAATKGIAHPGAVSYVSKVIQTNVAKAKLPVPPAPPVYGTRKPASADEPPWGGEPEKRPMTPEELAQFNYYAAMGREVFGSEGSSGDNT